MLCFFKNIYRPCLSGNFYNFFTPALTELSTTAQNPHPDLEITMPPVLFKVH